MTAPGLADAPLLAPDYMRKLIDRAAMLLTFQGVGACVSFPWWADGEETRYLARVKWWDGKPAPCVVVVLERSGEFVCQSLLGNFFEIDTSRFSSGPDHDEVDRFVWQQQGRKGRQS